MAQGNTVLPTVSPVTGLTLVGDMNTALLALITANSGASAPTNSTGGAPILGQFWLNTTSATAPVLNQYTGSAWVVLGTIDVTNGIWTPVIGGGIATTISSATTTDLGTKASAYLTVSGVTTITGFGTTAPTGSIKVVTFSGILQLTYDGTKMILPTAANITTAAGDVGWFVSLGSGNWKCLTYQLASGAALSAASTGSASLVASAQGMNAPLNLRINATVGSNALTVAIKTAGNADASAGSPILFPFRDATIANGDPVILSLQAALSFTVASTNSLGQAGSSTPFRLWVIAYYNGGTLAVGLFNASTPTNIYPLVEGNVVTTAASTNGGGSAGTHYANVSTITNTPFRIIGYLEWASGLSSNTTNIWASGPTTIQLFGPGIKKPGDVVQTVYVTTTTPTAVSSTAKAATALAGSITLTSNANLVKVHAEGMTTTASGAGNGVGLISQIWRNTAAVAIGPLSGTPPATAAQPYYSPVSNTVLDAPASSNWPATQYGLYISLTSGTTTINFLGTNASIPTNTGIMTIEEIMG